MKSKEQIYQAIQKYQQEHGMCPTILDLCEQVDVNAVSTVHYHLSHLRAEGRVTWEPQKKRTLKVVS